MKTASLEGRRILVVEDDYMIAQDVAGQLADAGAIVIGPAPSVARAMRLLGSEQAVDAAILDVNLGEETSFPVAQALEARGTPIVFSTGYNSADIPPEWQHVPVAMKPFRRGLMEELLGGIDR